MPVGLDLDQYQLKKRVLLIFAPTPRDARYREQHDYLIDDADDATARKLAVFGIFEDGPSFAEDRPISHEEAVRAREEFGVGENGFALHLIGLEGTEVLRSPEPLPLDALVRAMPSERS